jgi:release factor glutamine methyltransferase
VTPETLQDSYDTTRAMLAEFMPPPDADREARLIMCHALGYSAAQLLARLSDHWPPGDGPGRLIATLTARMARQPLAQIIGEWAFYGRDFHVTRDTLTPRPDTETLIDHALGAPFTRVLDLGTGSGAIAVTLLAENMQATGVATDISVAALSVALRNATRHGVAARLALQTADWCDGITGHFDLIVSNPPYVTAAAYATLPPEITDWEPREALTPGSDGLQAYRAIVAAAPACLTPGGRLLVEIGHDQGDAVARLFRDAGLDAVAIHPDINGTDRVVTGQCP